VQQREEQKQDYVFQWLYAEGGGGRLISADVIKIIYL
jgi:hypothetical protein